MYMERLIHRITPGRTAEFEASFAKSSELFLNQPGIQGASLALSLGRPNYYYPQFRWEARAHARAFRETKDYQDQVKSNAATGIYTSVTPLEAFELVHADGPEPGNFVTILDWTIDPSPANIAAFVATRKELFALRQQHSPVPVRCLLYRYLGGSNRYIAAMRAGSAEDLLAVDSADALQAWRRAHPYTLYGANPPIVDMAEVVFRTDR